MTQPAFPAGPPGPEGPDRGPLAGGASPDLERTAELLQAVRNGHPAAKNRLVARYLPILRRWAHGRLPAHARDLSDTDDLVQITLIRALDKIGDFEPRREGAFLAYLRQILLNSLRDEIRRVNRRPVRKDLDDAVADPSLVVDAVGVETMVAYERALATLPERQREAVVLRIEFGFSYQEVADAIESPSANAARMMVTRALAELAEVMDDSKGG
ncbi:MAG: RNA polymerase sigma factor [Gemmatimonadetes bacterium]|nr:RNA polymerase sigma factor [Gemmatimonadota bacterium]